MPSKTDAGTITAKLDALEEGALLATPGPWTPAYWKTSLEGHAERLLTSMQKALPAGGSESEACFVIADHKDEPEVGINVAFIGNGPMRHANTRHIANMAPRTTLALIAIARAAGGVGCIDFFDLTEDEAERLGNALDVLDKALEALPWATT